MTAPDLTALRKQRTRARLRVLLVQRHGTPLEVVCAEASHDYHRAVVVEAEQLART